MNIELEIQTAVQHWQAGRRDEAHSICQRVLASPINDPNIFDQIGVFIGGAGMFEAAAAFFARAEKMNPNVPEFANNLGYCLSALGKQDEAVATFHRALRLKRDHSDTWYNLGLAFHAQGKLADAISAYSKAAHFRPTFAEAYGNMGVAQREQGNAASAIETLLKAVQIKPEYPIALNNLGNLLWEVGRTDEAIEACRRSIAILPSYDSPYSNLGNALKEQGRVEEAHASYAKAVELTPTDPRFLSNLLYGLHFEPQYDAAAILKAHLEWDRRFGQPLRALRRPHRNNRDPKRRLRIGYVSPDFRAHPVGRFLMPLLEARDRNAFEVFSYSNTAIFDFMTEKIKAKVDRWRDIRRLSDDQAADLIREDQIDILIDLTMHTADNRLPIFARKPAPVQITYLAYCSTTGLKDIDYRLTDPYFDPPGEGDSDYSERSIRLPHTYYCYVAHVDTSDPGPLPAIANGWVTFSCLNNFCKISDDAIKLWCEILRAVPRSRLILHAKEGTHRQRLLDRVARESVDPQRIRFLSQVSANEYFDAHQQIDIALDPFPCGGGTTTCDALWMGVPVITLVGRTAVGRAGKSILSNVGLPELIAETPERYVKIATDLAGDLNRLAELRSTLRPKMLGSHLTHVGEFTGHAEAALREVWRRWCAS